MVVIVNDQIRQAVRFELIKQEVKQIDLAEKIGVSKQYINELMLGKSGGISETWQKILDELNLELITVPKDKVSDIKKALVD